MIIMMMTTKGKREVVPATKNVHISYRPRIIPALRKKGHICFCPRPAGTMSFLVNGYCRFAEEWITPELRCAHNWWMRVMQLLKTFAFGGKRLLEIKLTTLNESPSQWPRGQRRRLAAARLLGLCVRIPPGAWMSVASVVCCQVEVSATSWSLVQWSPTDCGASLGVI